MKRYIIAAALFGFIAGKLTSGVGDPLLCTLWHCEQLHVFDGTVHDTAPAADFHQLGKINGFPQGGSK